MARQEADREDLLREATALVERIEWRTPAGRSVVAGFRRAGGLSLYFDGDPVIQFTAAGELRRAFVDGRLLKAEAGRLVALDRRRDDRAVTLLRHDFTDEEQATLLATICGYLAGLVSDLRSGTWETVGVVPAGSDVARRTLEFLAQRLAQQVKIAESPQADPRAGRPT